MTQQRIHSNLAPIDLLTREELDQVATKHFDAFVRDRYRGIDAARLPPIAALGNGGTINLYSGGSSDGEAGPEQGDVWLLRRANVCSSAFATDTASYVLFRGSTPSDPVSGYTNRQLLNGMRMTPAVSYSTMGTPAVPATGVAVQNNTTQTYEVTVTGGTVTAVSVNGVTVGAGDGTYAVPSYGAITLTYSVAPTWNWVATLSSTSAQLGNNVGIEYDCPNKGGLFQPGEQLYAQVFNTTAGNTYLLSAEFIRVPAEMKGKILG